MRLLRNLFVPEHYIEARSNTQNDELNNIVVRKMIVHSRVHDVDTCPYTRLCYPRSKVRESPERLTRARARSSATRMTTGQFRSRLKLRRQYELQPGSKLDNGGIDIATLSLHDCSLDT
ncbi:hypothetical protein PUN28_003953 [Cardiocondyla obscurior]|uniref:Uncharacterized protein n=1 Tax=Cardiocondyla obscurior TaxID=286306 RepID=A0AAW2GNQ4_9HYME